MEGDVTDADLITAMLEKFQVADKHARRDMTAALAVAAPEIQRRERERFRAATDDDRVTAILAEARGETEAVRLAIAVERERCLAWFDSQVDWPSARMGIIDGSEPPR